MKTLSVKINSCGFGSVKHLWLISLVLLFSCNEEPSFPQGTAFQPPNLKSADANPGNSESFPVSVFQNQDLRWSLNDSTVVNNISMIKGPKFNLSSTQPQRTLFQDSMIQGGPGSTNNQGFSLAEAGHLDLLIVIDNSSSMDKNQAQLAELLDPILSGITNTNWRIAVVTTDNQCIRDAITRQDLEANVDAVKTRFKNAINAGITGSPLERGIEMAIKGFKEDSTCATKAGFANNVWFRSSSNKVVLIVSNEENCGSADNEACPDLSRDVTHHYTPDDFRTIGPANARVFGLLADPTNAKGTLDCSGGFDKVPAEYLDIVNSSGGASRPICDDDYAPMLSSMSADVGKIIHRQFVLAAPPEPGSLKVKVDGVEITSGFTVNGKTVDVAGAGIDPNAVNISFEYEAGAVPRLDQLNLTHVPDSETIEVTADGKAWNETKFSYDNESNGVLFSETPPDRCMMVVSYRENSPLPTQFQLPVGAENSGVDVEVSGARVSRSSFAVDDNGLVTMTKAPLDGKIVSLIYYKESNIQTSYVLDPLMSEFAANIRYTNGDETISSATTLNGQLEMDSDDVARLEEVTVNYEFNSASDFNAVTVPQDAIDFKWITGKDLDKTMACADPKISSDNKVDLSCFVQKYDSIKLSYKHLVERLASFELSRPVLKAKSMKVYIDGKETTDYSLNGQILTINRDQVSDTSVVKVEY